MVERRCAFLTLKDRGGFFIYDQLTYEPLADLGWTVEEIPWQQPNVVWDAYDMVVIRSPWDYQKDVPSFLKMLERIDRSSAQLQNPLDIVRWNLEKFYLRQLQGWGVEIVPTLWGANLDCNSLESLFRDLQTEQIVIKPTVGANADDTFRLARCGPEDSTEQAVATFRSRPFMAQPFLHSVVEQGEYSLFYFGGDYSHAVLKTPKKGDFRVQEEHGAHIIACQSDEELREAGSRAVRAIGRPLLYARVDLVYLASGQPAVMELELIEPSLYFPYNAESPRRFAQALDRISKRV
jgi:glutathione synthase/RimK-type ligase-like ATP-grasp enzyme